MCPTSSALTVQRDDRVAAGAQGVNEASARRVDGVEGGATPADDESLREGAQGTEGASRPRAAGPRPPRGAGSSRTVHIAPEPSSDAWKRLLKRPRNGLQALAFWQGQRDCTLRPGTRLVVGSQRF